MRPPLDELLGLVAPERTTLTREDDFDFGSIPETWLRLAEPATSTTTEGAR
jgi:hypothetical protein